MDLGFGIGNQQVGATTSQSLLKTAKVQEEVLENEISRYDALLEDDTALAQLRARRMAELQRGHEQRQQWLASGHGTYTELGGGGSNTPDAVKDFFEATKQSERLVVHFYRPTTRLCDMFHAHLAQLAPKHLETRFVKINVEVCESTSAQGATTNNGVSFLVERLGVVIMPTLVIVRNRAAIHQIRGFDELGGRENFTTAALEYVLGVHGAIHQEEDEEIPEELVENGHKKRMLST